MSHHTDINERCVVILGKCGAGKSTVANMIVGYDPMAEKSPFKVSEEVLAPVSRTVDSYKSCYSPDDRVHYNITVIDTVGLFDIKAKGNDMILEKIEEFFKKHHILAVNLILFVLKEGRFTPEEKEVFSFIRSRLSEEICPISALVVTGFETHTAEA